jgi:putative NADH-flavin reductase
MNIALLGATGRLGGAVLEAALAAGHRVTALVRDPSRLGARSERLIVVQGDARDRDTVERSIRGQDAVISALAISPSKSEAARRPLAKATRNIVRAMEERAYPALS